MKSRKLILGVLIGMLLFGFGCKKLEDVENLNNPDKATALANPDDLLGLAGGIVNNWFQTTQEYDGLALALWVASDHGTCSWGNAAMMDISSEPRTAWNNNPSYAYANTSREFYLGLNNVLSLSNDILIQIVNYGSEIGDDGEDTKMVEAIARWGQGAALGYLGLVFDQGYIVDESTDLEGEIPISTYDQLLDAAIDYLDMCIDICNNNTFTLPADWIPGNTWTNVELGKLANSFAARLMVYGSRNKTQDDALDWAQVKTYAQNGIDFTFEPLADDVLWYSLYQTYSVYGGWGQVDMRVINMLDPNMPDYFPSTGSYDDLPNQGVATSDDARLATDFEYVASCPFKPERGYYHFSSYRYARHDQYLTTWIEPMPEMRKAENDLFIAEAELMLGNSAAAIAILNAGERITRGGLAPVDAAATDVEVLDAIIYERTIELYLTGVGIPFFDMRRKDQLQAGTLLHFPIPGQQLDVMLMPIYTFGGGSGDGVNSSNGGWNAKKEIKHTGFRVETFGPDKPLIK